MSPRAVIRLLAPLVGLLVLFATSADARSPRWRPRPVEAAFSFRVDDASGRPLPVFRHHGQTFVWGNGGERFAVRIENPTSERVEAVLSVDGRDAVSGEVADFAVQRGYVIAPFSSVVVEGFRSSLDEVRAFRFTRPENSYSSRRGTPENVGIIGVAFFKERRRAPIALKQRPRPHTKAAPEASAPEAARSRDAEAPAGPRSSTDNLGTAYGERRTSFVTEVAFDREHSTRPSFTTTVRYDDRNGLVARGIDVSAFDRRVVSRQRDPQAFPVSRFAEPPP
jgi:hypothetical protein